MENDNISTLNEQVSNFSDDIAKFKENGNNAAGTRARKALLEISKLCKEIRKEIQEAKNAK
jgi:hypothetical protein